MVYYRTRALIRGTIGGGGGWVAPGVPSFLLPGGLTLSSNSLLPTISSSGIHSMRCSDWFPANGVGTNGRRA